MTFWRKELIDPALAAETRLQIDEQVAWIGREPGNAKPYYHLAQLYRVDSNRQDEALGLLLEAVRLDDSLADAHIALAEIYATRDDYPAAWRHARSAERQGAPRAVQMLQRHGIKE